MSTVMVRYSSPMMAFGQGARYDDRPTAATPNVSAIQGMIAAAAGIGRGEQWPDWVADLHLAIRIDQPGSLMVDYHTVNQPPIRRYRGLSSKDLKEVYFLAKAEGGKKETTVVSRRGYVQDACFVLAVQDSEGRISQVLQRPHWHLYAGRKSCPLTEPLLLGCVDESPEDALNTVPTTVPGADNPDTRRLSAVFFTEPEAHEGHEVRPDRSPSGRRYRDQQRWTTQVTPPIAPDWFAVMSRLKDAS